MCFCISLWNSESECSCLVWILENAFCLHTRWRYNAHCGTTVPIGPLTSSLCLDLNARKSRPRYFFASTSCFLATVQLFLKFFQISLSFEKVFLVGQALRETLCLPIENLNPNNKCVEQRGEKKVSTKNQFEKVVKVAKSSAQRTHTLSF